MVGDLPSVASDLYVAGALQCNGGYGVCLLPFAGINDAIWGRENFCCECPLELDNLPHMQNIVRQP